MPWTKLNFGKHEGKTLPQVLFSDPDWFFWAVEKEIFNDRWQYHEEVEMLKRRATSIIPKARKEGEEVVVEYGIHPTAGGMAMAEVVPKSRPPHKGSTPTFRRPFFDLSATRSIKSYDKLGAKFLVDAVKTNIFGPGTRMTKKRAEEFFDNPDNFGTP